jgi:hypothetical protein
MKIVGFYQSNMTSILHEVKIKLHKLSKKSFVVLKNCTQNKTETPLR